MSVTVHTAPGCVACEATTRRLDRDQIAYTAVDVTQDEDAYTRLVADGWTQMPVVTTPIGSWSGFRPDLHHNLAHLREGTA